MIAKRPIPRRSDAELLKLVDAKGTNAADRCLAAKVLVERGHVTAELCRMSIPYRCKHGRSTSGNCAACDEEDQPTVRFIQRYKGVMKAIEAEITAEYAEDCSVDANYQHLRHMFEGYREYMMFGEQACCPYHPGGARDFSWYAGVEAAKRDKTRDLTPSPIEDEET